MFQQVVKCGSRIFSLNPSLKPLSLYPGGPTKPLTQQGGDPALKPIKWKPSGTRYKKTTLWLIGPSSVPVIKGVSLVINVESSAFALGLRV